ncbi:hypothetical protein BDD43_5568 [Mucilaginibacter gracilis]|uniref:Uncharacterized protein n=1 Tax=Mucilaginibacter gracilis TaxID=423350 RepID=A0A495JA82_9SPHI|nr:hypothetical protein [Mucilaginibacter gracilis]RKR85304.1 hypothetical protein BDD43_5568 [Mucilaginibacter gracilis]
MDVTINNATDLKLEIARLKQIKAGQETLLKRHFNSPRALLGTITALFQKNKPRSQASGLADYDIGTLISKFLLSFTLNKTLLRKSNFIVKALVGSISQKGAGLVNNKTMAALFDKIRPHLPQWLIEKIAPKKRSRLIKLLSPKRQEKQRLLKP